MTIVIEPGADTEYTTDVTRLRRALRSCIRELEAVQRCDGLAPSTEYTLDIARDALERSRSGRAS